MKEELTIVADESNRWKKCVINPYLGNGASNKTYLKESSLRYLHRGIYRFLKWLTFYFLLFHTRPPNDSSWKISFSNSVTGINKIIFSIYMSNTGLKYLPSSWGKKTSLSLLSSLVWYIRYISAELRSSSKFYHIIVRT